MAKVQDAIREIHRLENLAERENLLCRLHPLSKVLVTLMFLVLVMSVGKYGAGNLLCMCFYPIALMIMGRLSVRQALRRLRPLLLAVCLIGAANPFFDRTPCLQAGNLMITGGMLSMLILLLKAGLAVFASYILIATTAMEQICYALRKLHVPQLLVILLLLIYRYVILMLKEADRLTQAYALRAPGQKGIHYKAWGSLAGQMLLRSMDRAETVYESMTLRGFHGEYYLRGTFAPAWQSVFYTFAWFVLLTVLRFVPIFGIFG